MGKVTVTMELPEPGEITGGLRLHDVHGGLSKAERAVDEAEAELERARERLAELERDVARLKADVPAGRATTAGLTEALRHLQAQALLVTERERQVGEARRSLDNARADAVAALEAEARRRVGLLQAQADKLGPVLDRLRELEASVRGALQAALGGQLDGRGRPVESELPWLRWPPTAADEGRLRSGETLQRLAASGLSPSEYARRFGVARHQER